MYQTYDAVLHGDTIEWKGERPADLSQNEDIEIEIRVVKTTPLLSKVERGKRMAAALEEIAQRGNINDAFLKEWEELRRAERILPGREE